MSKFALVLISLASVSACKAPEDLPEKLREELQELSGPTMGTQWRISLGENQTLPELSAVQVAVESELVRISALMSTWDPESELSRFNTTESSDPIVLNKHTIKLINTSLQVSKVTDGAYDVTRSNVFALWGFSADTPQPNAPGSRDLNQALQTSGWQALDIDNNSVAKTFPNLAVDLSSLAKGFAVDQIGEILRQFDVQHYAVNIGGEIETRGERSENVPWRIGIELPDGSGAFKEGLSLNRANLATSGSYRNVRIVDGQRVSHLMDGRTGMPITHDLVAATVIHESTMLADAWSTAFMLTGADWAKNYAQIHDLAVQLTQMVEKTPEKPSFLVWQSPKWKQLQ